MAYDLVIRNATIVDGTGAPRRSGGVAIEGGVIRAVGDVTDDARRVVDALLLMPERHRWIILRKVTRSISTVRIVTTSTLMRLLGSTGRRRVDHQLRYRTRTALPRRLPRQVLAEAIPTRSLTSPSTS